MYLPGYRSAVIGCSAPAKLLQQNLGLRQALVRIAPVSVQTLLESNALPDLA